MIISKKIEDRTFENICFDRSISRSGYSDNLKMGSLLNCIIKYNAICYLKKKNTHLQTSIDNSLIIQCIIHKQASFSGINSASLSSVCLLWMLAD